MNVIHSLSLKVIVLVLERIVGLESLHQASWPLMFYLVECMRPMVYDWSTKLLRNLKQQLTDCKLGRIKNFGYTNILSTFFFERVLSLILRFEAPPHSLWDPSQTHWAEVMWRLGGGSTPTYFPPEVFHW